MSLSKETLIAKRAVLKTKITKFRTYIQRSDKAKPVDIFNVTERLSELSHTYNAYETVQEQIELLDAEQIKDRDEFDDAYYEAKAEARVFLESHQPSKLTQKKPINNIHTIEQISNDIIHQTNLPPLALPSFNGLREQWLSFYETFVSMIHNESKLNNLQKLYYLKSCIKGDAAKIIETLATTADNYEIAFNLLVKRYDNKALTIKEHVTALFNLGEIKKPTAQALKDIVDKSNVHIKVLKNLSLPTDHWGVLLIHLLLTKLDYASKKDWENYNKEDIPDFNNFCEYLYKRSKTLESLEFERKPITNNQPVNFKFPPQTCNTATYNNVPIKCNYCNEAHYTTDCKSLLSLTVDNRWKSIQNLKLCKNCLKGNHITSNCKSLNRCKTCKRRHHTLLHLNELPIQSEACTSSETKAEQPTVINNFCRNNQFKSEILLSTALVEASDADNNTKIVRVLLDVGSQSNFICYSTCEKLKLKLNPTNYPIAGINNTGSSVKHSTSITIKSRFNQFNKTIDCLVIPKITTNLPLTSFNLTEFQIPKNIKLADDNFYISSPIDLLIGANLFWEIMDAGQIKIHKNQPYFQKTLLGWIVGGNINPKELTANFTVANLSTADNRLEVQLSKFWEIEQCPESNIHLSPDEAACENHYNNTTTRTPTGRYVVSLPFKSNIVNLGDTRHMALKRFYSLEKKLNQNSELKKEYSTFMSEYLNLQHMELAPPDKPVELTKTCYLPHHAVYKSSTNKLRVVFDASAKSSSNLSLNDALMVGPTIQQDLFSILVRFRTHMIVFSADICKMYRQILINPVERDYQRIFWRNDSSEVLREYRLKTVTYGTACAPYLAIKSIHQIVKDEGNDFELAPNIISRDFYVDDLLTGTDTIEQAIRLRDELIELLGRGKFELSKWVSNVPEVLPKHNAMIHLNNTDNVDFYKQETKVLGITWNCNQDSFKYLSNLNPSSNNITKRNILSVISQLFDPLGLIGPVIVNTKIMLQRLWLLKISWDEPVPTLIQSEWKQFIEQLVNIKVIEIPRNINPHNSSTLELHGFADASQFSYGACIYLRTINKNKEYTSQLICAKSRVAPVKSITIPRLELCAAVLLTTLMEKTKKALNLNIKSLYYWTDSTIVLSWLKGTPNNWKTFVANRVSQIQTNSAINQWNHVSTHENPADIISRGTSVVNLNKSKLWWEGPAFLKTENLKFNQIELLEIPPEIKRPKALILTQTLENNNLMRILENVSNFYRIIKIVSYILRFIYNSRYKSQKRTCNITSDEINDSKVIIFKIIQQQYFSNEINLLNAKKPIDRTSKLISLQPFIGNDGLLRVGGRLRHSTILPFNQKFPIILPSKHHITDTLIVSEHRRLLHAGPLATIYSLRENYWIISSRNRVKQLIHKCVKCFRASPKPHCELMGDLPKTRVEPSRPFLNCGLDYAGPILIKESGGRGKRKIKAYIVVFVCFATRAIHLELALDLTADGFINALKRFISRRGNVSNIYSDNGTNFIGANNELINLAKLFHSQNNLISTKTTEMNIKWHFIPPNSPNFGGLWEAAVKSCKKHLIRTVGNASLTYDEMYTVLVRIEACLNSRPLTPTSSDPNDLNPLTPGHFLIGSSLTSFAEPDITQLKMHTLSRWQHVERIRQEFWKRWSQEYLTQLQERSKWKTASTQPVKINDLVLIKDDSLPPLKWPLGRITELHPGADNIVRTVSIKTATGMKKRSVTKVCVLPGINVQ